MHISIYDTVTGYLAMPIYRTCKLSFTHEYVNYKVEPDVPEWNALGQCDQQFDELCNAIATNRTLARLDLRNNQLGNSHGVQLAQLLATNPMLRVLDLRWNRIGFTGGREIVEALKHNSTIEELLLEGNGLSR